MRKTAVFIRVRATEKCMMGIVFPKIRAGHNITEALCRYFKGFEQTGFACNQHEIPFNRFITKLTFTQNFNL